VPGTHRSENIDAEYTARILSFIDTGSLRPLRLVVNAGNGCAGPYFDRIAEPLPFETVRVHHEPDGTFPNGVPNPLLEENRPATADAVRAHRADMGVAWDGDFDRCFFFDENGEFVDGYYVVGLLASRLLKDRPGSAVIHDPRMIWNTVEMVREAGGVPVQWKTGHAFIKEKMRAEDAVYGGEMSAHHYFRDFAYCDSGMVPWLLMAALLSETGKPLSRLVAERRERYPSSGEINHRVTAPEKVIAAIRAHFEPQCTAVDEMDGIGVTFGDRWRFNIRCSQTEPILRLNVEARGDAGLMQARTDEILGLIQANS
jgi:phosphomannomutase